MRRLTKRVRERVLAEMTPLWEQEAERLRARPSRIPLEGEKRFAIASDPKAGIAGRPRPKNCEVCGLEGRICFDHCHATEKFRGWLCTGCNTALGMAKDNPSTLRALADYLERFVATADKVVIPADREKPEPFQVYDSKMVRPSGPRGRRGKHAPRSLNNIRWN